MIRPCGVLTTAFYLVLCFGVSRGLSMSSKDMYGVPNSSWKSRGWNWGSSVGTGHDCALLCRQQYSTRAQRSELVKNLIDPAPDIKSREPQNFEQVKLVLALAWQNGRWDGSDGGPEGYSQVLETMAKAQRYERGSEEECAGRFIHDLKSKFSLLEPTPDELSAMMSIDEAESDFDRSRRQCSGLVLQAMGFVDSGL
jgi:hypothetical protein